MEWKENHEPVSPLLDYPLYDWLWKTGMWPVPQMCAGDREWGIHPLCEANKSSAAVAWYFNAYYVQSLPFFLFHTGTWFTMHPLYLIGHVCSCVNPKTKYREQTSCEHWGLLWLDQSNCGRSRMCLAAHPLLLWRLHEKWFICAG